MGRMVTEIDAAGESQLGWEGAAGNGHPATVAAAPWSIRRLSVPILASVVVAEALGLGALATSGNIPVLVLKAFRLLLTL